MGDRGPGLVGRDREQDWLLAAFDRRRHRAGPPAAVVHGRAGVGVSALLEDLAAALQHRQLPHEMWWGRSSRGDEVPYAPVAALLQRAPGGAAAWLRDAAHLSGSLADAAPTALLVGLASRLCDAAQAAPLVAVVDGIDALDVSTRRLLMALPALVHDARVLLVFAGRSGGDERAPIDIGSALADELLLTPLRDTDVERVVRRSATDLPDEQVDMIVRVAAGRPGLARQLMSAPDPIESVGALLAGAGPGAAATVNAAAIAGGALTVDILRDALGIGTDVLSAVVTLGAVRVERRTTGPPGIELAGVWWAEAARQIEPDVTSLAGALAHRLADLGVGPPALVARLWEQAGQVHSAASAHRAAADAAAAEGAIASAAHHLRRAVALAPAGVDTGQLVRAARLSLASADWDEADALARRALGLLERDDVETRIELLVLRYRARFEGGLGDADQPLDDALAELTASGRASVEAMVLDAYRLVFHDPESARRQVGRAVELATRLDADARATALTAAGVIESLEGDRDLAIAHARAAMAAAVGSADQMVSARAASNHVYVLWRAGRPRDVEREARRELDRLAAMGAPWLGDQLALARAIALTTLGRLDDADQAIIAARAIRASADAGALLDLAEAEIALIRNLRALGEQIIEAVARGPSVADPTVSVELSLRRAELELARNDRARAARAALDGLAAAPASDDLGRARLLVTALRAGADVAEDDWPGPSGAEVAALLAEASALRAPSGDAFRGAASAWAGVPGPIAELRCLLDAAVVDRSLADVEAVVARATELGAAQLAEEASAAWRALGGRRVPRRVTGPLTEREAEVLTLVARGLTNKDVAAELGISPKTVAVHLERCLAKLGASTRGAAVHEARRAGVISA